MKKILLRAEAALIAVSVFFCSIVYKPVTVYAVIGVDDLILMFAAAALGHYLFEPAMDWVDKKLGWKPEDIQVDENGNVILSEKQMQELKDAIKEYTQDENGNDKYGMYLYESTSQLGFDDFLGVNAYYDAYYWQDRGNLDLVLGLTDVWFVHSNQGSYCNAPPAGAIWVCPDPASTAVNFYHSGTLLSSPSQYYRLRWAGNNWEWYEWAHESASAATSSGYFGKPQTCFLSLEGAREWKNDGSPYTLTAPTYTGGDLVIPKDQLQNPGTNPDDLDNPGGGDDDEDTSTELGVLQAILKWVKKIYNQVVLGNVINAIDAVAQVMDTVKDYLDEGLEDAAAVAGLAEDLGTKFPFSLPQDVLLILTVFEAEPQVPVWKIPFRADFGGPTGIKIDEEIEIDFTDFEDSVNVLKWFLGIIWLWGLVVLTPKVLGVGNDAGGN